MDFKYETLLLSHINGGAYRFFDGHSPLIIEEKVEQQWGD
jgi:hypothetical protein